MATCERLFSELGNIHTPIRNRMDAVKASLIESIREHSRRSLAKKTYSSLMKEKKRTRIISPVESDDASDADEICFMTNFSPASSPESSRSESQIEPSDAETESAAACVDEAGVAHLDDATEEAAQTIEFWDSFLEEIDIEVGEEDAANVAVTSNPIDPYEEISPPCRPPLPNENDLNFPQEKKLEGIRAYKVTLADLFSSVDLKCDDDL
ncbi:hypothetical protein KRP22_009610 [Phytophthora ramorum]|nr:hypothetical protein KRP22_8443 [Phytophthora ramorum]